MIIDAQCHLGPVLWQSPPIDPPELRQRMAAAGVDKACCYSFIDRIDNEYVYEAARGGTDLIPFACIDASQPDAPDELERWLKAGMQGMKLHPYIHGYRLSSRVMDALFELCTHYEVPVVCHLCDESQANTVWQAAHMADRFRGVNLIALHSGFLWSSDDMFEAASTRPNLYLETSLISPAVLRRGVARIGAEKFVFGTDTPFFHFEPELLKVRRAVPDLHAQEAILGRTMARLLKLSLVAADS